MSPFVISTVFLALLVGASAGFNSSGSACPKQYEGKEIVEKVLDVVRKTLPNSSFEAYDFKVDWYNQIVPKKFKLNYTRDTVALSLHTIPGIFKESFTPFLCDKGKSVFNDSWQNMMEFYMGKVLKNLKDNLTLDVPEKDILYAGKMLGLGHPAVLVQRAAHVAGAAYYYQRTDVANDTWPKNKTIYGVSLHPKYGGWFYMGPVIILDCVKYADMPRKQPTDRLKTGPKIIDFLNKANGNWRDNEWRNVIEVEKNYSSDYLAYRNTYGKKRTEWVKNYYNDKCCGTGGKNLNSMSNV